MTPEQRKSWAQQLLDNPLLIEVLSDMEQDAIAFVMNAAPQEHDVRQAKAAELRAIRDLGERIKAAAASSAPQRVKSIA